MPYYRPLLLLATLLAFCVIALGAYVRLSDAGLGCPDWPGCYGKLFGVPEQVHEQAAALQAFPGKPVQTQKAWKEMLHRYLAGSLGLFILAIAAVAWRKRRLIGHSPTLPGALLAVVVAQALLGMWTVTLLLKPVVVTAHLAGGMTTLALLVWLGLRQTPQAPPPAERGLRLLGLLALTAIAAQIVLGGWVSSNYAALACPDFPACQGYWLPEMDFRHAFQLRRELGLTASGSLLANNALTAIHWTHRVGALGVFAVVGTLSLILLRRAGWRTWGFALGLALLTQIALGIANVLLSLPLPLAVAHNSGAALLLVVTLAVNFCLWSRHHPTPGVRHKLPEPCQRRESQRDLRALSAAAKRF